ncbi:site-specific integrase [Halorussus salinus]|uniref:site-specific integrase n=1 Tax=Halorussus salinus TaxID=1364935 RepID=UPI0010921BD5|nr:tyrosine-type recombinase/integrase [Halorussus salinus]
MTDPRDSVETLREKIENGERDIDQQADRDALLEFSRTLDLLSTEYSDYRHLKLLRHCTRMAEHVGGLADALDDRDAAEDIVAWINRTYDNEETNRDYRSAIRVFGKRTTDSDDAVPESLAWVPTGTSSNYDPKPDPTKMLHWDDRVQPMIDAAMNPRDAALVAVAWDAGPRAGELKSLRVGDVTDHRHGLQITVDGKVGQRTITLILSVPHLQRWLDAHPDSGDDTAPLWSKVTSPDSISDRMFTKLLDELAERAEVSRPVTLTNFRKSSASYLASQGMNQAHLEDHHGWTRGSEHAARYISVFGDQADNELARIHGVEVAEEDEPDDFAPVTCPRCNEQTPRERDFCVHCQQSLDLEAKQLLDEVTETLDSQLVESDDPEDRRDLVRARRTLDEKPGVMDRDELHDLASSLSSDDD